MTLKGRPKTKSVATRQRHVGRDKSGVSPPVQPMLAKLATSLPEEGDFLFEPKWDGFRAIVFRSASDIYIQSRDMRPFNRYFPDLAGTLLKRLPAGCVIDGEIVVATAKGLDFDALQLRLHPAASRVAMLAAANPASFVAFDLLAYENRSLMTSPQQERREKLEQLLEESGPPLFLTPMTRELKVATRWLAEFEGAGLDGVIAKAADLPYQPGKRVMIKVKHARTAECVVAGLRWYKDSTDAVGSLLLGLFDDKDVLHHVGVTSSFPMATRKRLAVELAPLRRNAMKQHPWRDWAKAGNNDDQRMPGAQSRWSVGKDLSWEPLQIARVCEVKYDHLQGDRFRHGAIFLRWRPDKLPQDCRYDQLEVVPPYELARIFATNKRDRGAKQSAHR